jgi:hypothetical protein
VFALMVAIAGAAFLGRSAKGISLRQPQPAEA